MLITYSKCYLLSLLIGASVHSKSATVSPVICGKSEIRTLWKRSHRESIDSDAFRKNSSNLDFLCRFTKRLSLDYRLERSSLHRDFVGIELMLEHALLEVRCG